MHVISSLLVQKGQVYDEAELVEVHEGKHGLDRTVWLRSLCVQAQLA